MKMINSIAGLAIYALTISMFATTNEATAGDFDYYMGAHRNVAAGTPITIVAALEERALTLAPKSETTPAPTSVERAETAFTRQLNFECEADTQMHWLAEDDIYEYALNRADMRLQLNGKLSVIDHLCALTVTTGNSVARNIYYFPTLKHDIVYVQYDLVAANGMGASSGTLAIIQMRESQIVRFTQLTRSPESMAILTTAM